MNVLSCQLASVLTRSTPALAKLSCTLDTECIPCRKRSVQHEWLSKALARARAHRRSGAPPCVLRFVLLEPP